MTIDTTEFRAITGRLAALEARMAEIDATQASQAIALERQDSRVCAIFEALALMCQYSRVPIRLPRHLRLVRPDEHGGAA
jgi:hypothetical protein